MILSAKIIKTASLLPNLKILNTENFDIGTILASICVQTCTVDFKNSHVNGISI